ncbi:MAG: cytochrome C oxidase assembly protein [Bacteroidales bacterium]|jgi:cytochrome d ubiquinol oxidase subunit II|nr:cytochrome C oxidase assembly protein [Bacteroidales bacterium]HPM17586.1 cytochrome d ubiquinol oxidase subunit II [Bacteroidales bacterium]HQG77670.1 cytochrome d ubiquinol oxidase subunit II [Bacteroidales bacterium]
MEPLISHLFLQHYWWIIISILAGLLVFLLFVQGGQSMIFSLPEDPLQTTILVNALGRKWEFTFTTLVTFGGAFFAAFPLFYSASFGGAYWVWMAILFSFIIQAVAYEFRSKKGNFLGQRTYDIFLLINGSLGPFLLGVAVATFFTGARFSLNELNRVSWATGWHGLEALVNGRNVALGLAVLFLARTNGLLYIINSVNDDGLYENAGRKIILNALTFLVFFLFFLVTLLISPGFAYDPHTGNVFIEKYKYLHNLLRMPAVLIIFVAGVVGVLYGIVITVFRGSRKGIWFTGTGTILAVISLFLLAGFSNTAFYPSTFDLNSSLSIRKASSSYFTLKTMMFVSFIIPFVAAYIWYAWKAINRRRISVEEIQEEGHVY